MALDEVPHDTVTIDSETVAGVQRNRERKIIRAVRVVALGAVVSWGILAYGAGAHGASGESHPSMILVIFSGLWIALYGRRMLNRAVDGLFDELKLATKQQTNVRE
jgi:hypothetical protein